MSTPGLQVITRTGGREPGGTSESNEVAEHVRAALLPVAPRTASDLDAALDAGLLTVAYQPVVSLATGEVVAAEALARLHDPATGQLLAPDAFVPLAERTGRIARIDRMVLAEAVPEAVRWRALLGARPFSIGVNLSVAGLSHPGLADHVRRICDRAGLPCDALVIEVTETALSVAGDGHDGVLRAVHDLGCNVTMDDFGTGYSSLSHLARFPIDGIKIDRRFVWDIGTSGRGGLVPGALVRLGRDLGLHVVAEGVETPQQLAALQDAGCPFAQGFLISRPLTAEALTAFLLASRRGVPLPRNGFRP
jgi:EAL domain-containing protein (putative c-di-GMP-specific phosphodiesterase class I)